MKPITTSKRFHFSFGKVWHGNWEITELVTATTAKSRPFAMGVFLSVISVSTQAQTVLYVDQSAPGPIHDGWTWCTAFTDLQDALDVAVFNVTIRVADGVYRPDGGTMNRGAKFAVPSSIILEGGFAGCGAPDPDAMDRNLYPTVLSGDLAGNDSGTLSDPTRQENSFMVVDLNNAELRGFVIKGGQRNGPSTAGINVLSSKVVSCFLTENSTTGNGGAIYTEGNSEVRDCEFVGNNALGEGGGLFATPHSSQTIVTGCLFENNSASNGGGLALRLRHLSGANIDRCIFYSNSAGSGGAIFHIDEESTAMSPTVSNSIFVSNTSNGAGAAISSQAGLKMLGSTTYGNLSLSANQGRGFAGYGTIVNSILWDGIGTLPSNFDAVQVSYSNVFGGWPGVGNIFQPPGFVDPDGPDNALGSSDDDFRLLDVSPCVNAGDPAATNDTPSFDLGDNPRVVGGRIDMGAFELFESCQLDADCIDHDPCTIDSCDSQTGCSFAPACGPGYICQDSACLPYCGKMDTDDDGDIDLTDLAVWQNCFDGPMP